MMFKNGLLLFIGAAAGSLAVITTQQLSADSPPPILKEEPLYRSLDANLYQQTSAEYRACCLQAFNLAQVRLGEQLAKQKENAKPPAIILDLDETVLDNSGFQAMIARSGLGFDGRLWEIWEARQGDYVGLVPGAKEFLSFAEEKKVAIFYISNRTELYKKRCAEILKRLGVGVPDDRLLLADDTSDKTARRATIAEKFTVVMMVGDNLRDFDEQFRFEKGVETKPVPEAAASIAARNKKVDDNKAKFGAEWIILPNSVYGEWSRPFGRGKLDLEFLRPVRVEKN